MPSRSMPSRSIPGFSILLLTALLGALPVLPACGQDAELTMERIFASDDFSIEGFGPARWFEDGSG